MAICKCWCGRQTGLSIIDGDWHCPDHCQSSPSSATGGEGCYYCNKGKVGACDCKPLTPQEPGTGGEWMPIESAPKDDRFLAVVDGHVRIVKWGKTSHLNLYGFCLADQGVEDFDRCNPVCWMPLPLPPAPQVKS